MKLLIFLFSMLSLRLMLLCVAETDRYPHEIQNKYDWFSIIQTKQASKRRNNEVSCQQISNNVNDLEISIEIIKTRVE